MKDPRSLERSPEVLSESVRTRLLERATELDSAYGASGTVVELQAAALEAANVRAALNRNDEAGSPACAR